MGESVAEVMEERARRDAEVGAVLSAAKKYVAQLEEKIKSHFRRPSDGQPPPDAVIIPPLTTEQYAAVKDWSTAVQVGTVMLTEGSGLIVGAIIGFKVGGPAGGLAGGVIGTIIAAGWGAYETNCIASVQEEFDKAQEDGNGVQVWREGFWSFGVYGGGDTYTEANGPLSATYVAITTWVLTGNVP